MRARIWLCGAILAAAALIGWCSLSTVPAAQAPAKGEAKSPLDDRDALANKLMERVAIDKGMKNVQLRDMVEYLSDKHGITVLVDHKSFRNNQGAAAAVAVNAGAEEDMLDQQVSLPAMKNVRLATVLKQIADQIDAVYMVEADHIRLVGLSVAMQKTNAKLRNYTVHAAGEVNVNEPDDGAALTQTEIFRLIPLVTAHFTEKPLQEALREIESRANWTVVLASQVGDKGKTLITGRFANVPVDTAVASLAEMAGLKMARKGNVLLVTTEERAKAFDPPAPPMLQGYFGGGLGLGGGLGGGFVPQATLESQIQDLTKKIGDLEKTIAELKKDKK